MKLLMLGSGPGATTCREWPRGPFDKIIAINNAWRLRPDWDALIYPFDFPPDRMPSNPSGTLVDEKCFVPAQNAYGGFLFGGATMAFTATYWALDALKPDTIAYLGCDMVYPGTGATHFYGKGTADPLRKDVSLRSLEAKSARALCLAARQGCSLVNLSASESRLVFPRATRFSLDRRVIPQQGVIDEALLREAALEYETPTGFHDHISPDLAELDAIDALWLGALEDVSARAS